MKTKKQRQNLVDAVYGGFVLACLAVTITAGIYASEDKAAIAVYEPIRSVQAGESADALTCIPEFVTDEIEPSISLYNIPLDVELQKFIIDECEAHGIDPAIIMAMAWKESNFKPGAVGDSGKSFGLLQIQKRWHEERMEQLGVDDLLDPYQNIMVAVDYMDELICYYDGNVEKAVVAYNMGQAGAKKYCFDYGVYSSKYSRAVMAKAEELRGEMYVYNG